MGSVTFNPIPTRICARLPPIPYHSGSPRCTSSGWKTRYLTDPSEKGAKDRQKQLPSKARPIKHGISGLTTLPCVPWVRQRRGTNTRSTRWGTAKFTRGLERDKSWTARWRVSSASTYTRTARLTTSTEQPLQYVYQSKTTGLRNKACDPLSSSSSELGSSGEHLPEPGLKTQGRPASGEAAMTAIGCWQYRWVCFKSLRFMLLTLRK